MELENANIYSKTCYFSLTLLLLFRGINPLLLFFPKYRPISSANNSKLFSNQVFIYFCEKTQNIKTEFKKNHPITCLFNMDILKNIAMFICGGY